MAPFTRTAATDLPALRTRTIERLAALERADPPWQRFYAGRRAAFQALEVTATGPAAGGGTAAAPAADPRTAAAQAVKTGDMRGLEKLAEAMMVAVEPRRGSAVPERSASGPVASEAAKDLFVSYGADTLEGARRLGLAARRLESRAELASLRAYAWNPLFADQSGRIKQVPLPADTPEAFREPAGSDRSSRW